MDAMILAAGLGTRLRPLTHEKPKALVEVNSQTLLERTARRLVDVGADRLIINTHYFAERVHEHVREQKNFGVDARLSHESGTEALGTGGGIVYAKEHFRKDTPFFLHNADIVTDVDLAALYAAHQQAEADRGVLATLLVRPTEPSRHLAFDDAGRLVGYGPKDEGDEVLVGEPQGAIRRVDYLGVQVISPRFFEVCEETGVFGLVNLYLKLARERDERFALFELGEATWHDVGTLERLEVARTWAAGEKRRRASAGGA